MALYILKDFCKYVYAQTIEKMLIGVLLRRDLKERKENGLVVHDVSVAISGRFMYRTLPCLSEVAAITSQYFDASESSALSFFLSWPCFLFLFVLTTVAQVQEFRKQSHFIE